MSSYWGLDYIPSVLHPKRPKRKMSGPVVSKRVTKNNEKRWIPPATLSGASSSMKGMDNSSTSSQGAASTANNNYDANTTLGSAMKMMASHTPGPPMIHDGIASSASFSTDFLPAPKMATMHEPMPSFPTKEIVAQGDEEESKDEVIQIAADVTDGLVNPRKQSFHPYDFYNNRGSKDWKELVGFIGWFLSILGILVSGVSMWVLFFELVVRPETTQQRVKGGGTWLVFATAVLYARYLIRSKCGPALQRVLDHAEIFIAVSLVMVFSSNSAFVLHSQSKQPLRDIGFMILPELGEDSWGSRASDVMTISLPILCLFQSFLMKRENRLQAITSFCRLVTICYALRAITIPLTALPGPAPHCRPGSLNYFPPENWIDVVTRVGSMHGKFNTCGDLLFSGHMCYTNSTLLLYLRTLDRVFKKYSMLRWVFGISYLLTVAVLTIASRKHYTVDVVLGIIISTMVFFHFEHGWKPTCLQTPAPTQQQQIQQIHHHQQQHVGEGIPLASREEGKFHLYEKSFVDTTEGEEDCQVLLGNKGCSPVSEEMGEFIC